MKRVNFTIMLTSLFFVIPNIVYSQSARDVYKSFKKLESKIEVGINYMDYSSALGDINYEVKEFLDSREAKSKPKLADSIKMVLTHYMNAKRVWEDKSLTSYYQFGEIERSVDKEGIIHFKTREVDYNSFNGYLLKTYPKMMPDYEISREILVEKAIKIIWDAASIDLKKTKALLVK